MDTSTPARARRLDIGATIKRVLLWFAMCSPLAFQFGDENRSVWLSGLSLAVITVAAVFGRERPMAACLAVLVLSAVDWRLLLAVLVLAYNAGRRRPIDGVVLGAFAGSMAIGSALLVIPGVDLYTWLVWLAGAVAFAVFPVLVGSFRRLQVELVRAGWDHAEHLEREQKIIAEQARLQERARMAHDMHDSLGHEISLIALRAGALELDAGLNEQNRKAVAGLRAGVSTAAERLNEIIWLLRDETEPASLRPIDEHIEELVGRALDSGMSVTLEILGDHSDVAPLQYRAAYRVVQESLTNAAKHASGTDVDVRLERSPAGLVVTVRNDKPGVRAPSVPAPRGGRGLTGLRERVGLAGGVLRYGFTELGGFEIIALLPAQAEPVMRWASDLTLGEPTSPAAAGFKDARLRVRKGLVLALSVPAVLVVALGGTLMALYAQDSLSSRLMPQTFRDIPIGSSRDDLSEVLPEKQVPERRDEAGPVPPVESRCEYYRSSAGFLPAPFDVYRLCFRDGVLIAKDVLPPPSR